MTKSLPKVAIIGRPNVGKSTLFNRFIGFRKALVQDKPGITRDAQMSYCDWDGVAFYLIDTAGLEQKTQESLKTKTTQKSLQMMSQADIVILLMDIRDGLTTMDEEWISKARKLNKPIIYAVNKVDSIKQQKMIYEFYEKGLDPLISISAEAGPGMSELLDKLKEFIVKFYNQEWNLVNPEDELKKQSYKIALIGRPNVGKSTLLNQILGEDRSIVDPTPGTTRDTVNSYINYQNQVYCFIDTAGIRRKGRTTEVIEKISIMRSIKAIEESDGVLLLIDGEEGFTEQDSHVCGEALKRNKIVVVLINKQDVWKKNKSLSDLKIEMELKMNFIQHCPVLPISAKNGSGVDSIFSVLMDLKNQYEKKIPTSKINKVFEQIVKNHPLPVYQGQPVKIFYATQTSSAPPTFIIFTNRPKNIHFSYKRYLINALRKAFDINQVPVKLIFKGRK